MAEDGKRIDTFMIARHNAELRWLSNKMSFILNCNGHRFEGDNARKLRDDAEVIVLEYDKLTWTPKILIDAEPGDQMNVSYHRVFQAHLDRRAVYRAFRVNGEDEGAFSRWNDPETGDTVEGSAGDVIHPNRSDTYKILPYTPERWLQIRKLDAALAGAMAAAREKLKKILESKDVDTFLANVSAKMVPGLMFDAPEKPKEIKL